MYRIIFIALLTLLLSACTPIPTSSIKPQTEELPKFDFTDLAPAVKPSRSSACSCSGNTYNCDDFSTHRQAQACFDYCRSLGKGDVHRLDRDSDGSACETLP